MDEFTLESEVRRVYAPQFAAAASAARAWLAGSPEPGARFSVAVGPEWLDWTVSGMRKDKAVSLSVRRGRVSPGDREVAWGERTPTPAQSALLDCLPETGTADFVRRLRDIFRDLSAMGLSPDALVALVAEGVADHVLGD